MCASELLIGSPRNDGAEKKVCFVGRYCPQTPSTPQHAQEANIRRELHAVEAGTNGSKETSGGVLDKEGSESLDNLLEVPCRCRLA